MSKNNDCEFGEQSEKANLNIIENKLNCKLYRTTNKYSIFDYVGDDDCFVELKTRRNTKDKYYDTMVGYNKLVEAEKMDKSVYFFFCFTDGLFFWRYNKDDILNGNVEIRTGGRNDRGRPEFKNYAFIKTNILSKVEPEKVDL